MIEQQFALIIVAYMFLTAMFCGLEMGAAENMTNHEQHFLTPTLLYEKTKINKFGCWFIAILLCFINSFGGIYKLVHFVFTVGKKSHENFQSKIAEADRPQTEATENYKIAEQLQLIAVSIMGRETNCELCPEYKNISWNDLCDKGIELFEKLKEEELKEEVLETFDSHQAELLKDVLLYEAPEKIPEPSYVVNTDTLPKGKVSYYPTNKKTKSLFLEEE